jgi:hypothetical protein
LVRSKGARHHDSSVLIVVGRQESGGLEAQIRWKRLPAIIRFVAVTSLLSLLLLKVRSKDSGTLGVLSSKIFDLLASGDFFNIIDINPAIKLLDVYSSMKLSERPIAGLFPTMTTLPSAQAFDEDANRSAKEIRDNVDDASRKGEVRYVQLRRRFHRLGAERFKRRMNCLVADDDHPKRELKVVERRGLSGRAVRGLWLWNGGKEARGQALGALYSLL